MSTIDPLVEDYLRRLDIAATSLPPEHRSDLLDEISEHIAVARASGAADDEAGLRNVLERLGPPEVIVAAAHDDEAPPGWGTSRAYASGGGDTPPLVPQPPGTGLELAAVLLLTAGSFLPVVGWLVGVVLLWTSPLWRVREKLLGTLVVPLGPGVALYGAPLLLGRTETCTTSSGFVQNGPQAPPGPPPAGAVPQGAPGEPPPQPDLQYPIDGGVTTCEVSGVSAWVALPLALVLVVAPIVVAVVLYRIARRRAAQAPPTMVPAPGVALSAWGPLEIGAVLLLGLGGFLVPVLGALVGLVLACVSRRWTMVEKVVAGVLALSPAVLLVAFLVLPLAGLSVLPVFPGGFGVFLLVLVACPVAAMYLAVVLSRRPAASPTSPAGVPTP